MTQVASTKSKRIAVVDSSLSLRTVDRVREATGVRWQAVLERWDQAGDGQLYPPRWNPFVESAPDARLAPASFQYGDRTYPSIAELAEPNIVETDFPIDIVYTWVDGTDEAWATKKSTALRQVGNDLLTESAADDLRFVDHDELRYSLRSVEQSAPWVRHIWLVTDNQVPAWLNQDHPGLTVVDHRDIWTDPDSLPTFNSHAIEAHLHRIPGLAEHFIYFNDDMFLSSAVAPTTFFNANGLPKIFYSRAQVGLGDPIEGESASDSAGKNIRRLISNEFSKQISRKLFHVPYSLRKSLAKELEELWPEEISYTRQSRFRRIGDVTVAGALQLQYALASGQGTVGKIRYRYVDIGGSNSASELERVYHDRFTLQTFCLNEASANLPPDIVDRQVRRFLERMYPNASSYELG